MAGLDTNALYDKINSDEGKRRLRSKSAAAEARMLGAEADKRTSGGKKPATPKPKPNKAAKSADGSKSGPDKVANPAAKAPSKPAKQRTGRKSPHPTGTAQASPTKPANAPKAKRAKKAERKPEPWDDVMPKPATEPVEDPAPKGGEIVTATLPPDEWGRDVVYSEKRVAKAEKKLEEQESVVNDAKAKLKKLTEDRDAAVREMRKVITRQNSKQHELPFTGDQQEKKPTAEKTKPATDGEVLAESAAQEAAEIDDEWRSTPIAALEDHGLRHRVVEALIKANIWTIGDLADYSAAKDGRERRLKDIAGIGPAKQEAIEVAMMGFWDARKAPKPIDILKEE